MASLDNITLETHYITLEEGTVMLDARFITYINIVNIGANWQVQVHTYNTDRVEFSYAVCATEEEAKEKLSELFSLINP